MRRSICTTKPTTARARLNGRSDSHTSANEYVALQREPLDDVTLSYRPSLAVHRQPVVRRLTSTPYALVLLRQLLLPTTLFHSPPTGGAILCSVAATAYTLPQDNNRHVHHCESRNQDEHVKQRTARDMALAQLNGRDAVKKCHRSATTSLPRGPPQSIRHQPECLETPAQSDAEDVHNDDKYA